MSALIAGKPVLRPAGGQGFAVTCRLETHVVSAFRRTATVRLKPDTTYEVQPD
jgi:hypothetical protein